VRKEDHKLQVSLGLLGNSVSKPKPKPKWFSILPSSKICLLISLNLTWHCTLLTLFFVLSVSWENGILMTISYQRATLCPCLVKLCPWGEMTENHSKRKLRIFLFCVLPCVSRGPMSLAPLRRSRSFSFFSILVLISKCSLLSLLPSLSWAEVHSLYLDSPNSN
jgi:hypothetical protein